MLVLYEGEIVCENVLRMLGFTFIFCIERAETVLSLYPLHKGPDTVGAGMRIGGAAPGSEGLIC
jgi:hypothetical protein